MSAPIARASGISSAPGDIDPGLLQKTQLYLACLSRRQTPGSPLSEAWDRFYRIIDPVIRRFASGCGAAAPDLDDCAQEVWTTLVTHLRDFHLDPRRGRFLSWLYTLVRSKAADQVRGRARHPAANLTHAAGAELRGPDADPAAEYEMHRQQTLVHAVLDELRQQVSERSYRVVYLRWIEGRTIPEIAAALNLTPQQVRFRSHRMKQKFHILFDLCTRNGFDSDG